jgi:hypothetical protein
MVGEIEQDAEFEKIKQLAYRLAGWDKRIAEISAILNLEENEENKLDLICRFKPEPEGDAQGFFWIAVLLTRMEMETLDELLGICQPFDLGFKLGEQVFLPNGKILNEIGDSIVLWPHDEPNQE